VDTTIIVTGTDSYWSTLGKSGADDAGFFLVIGIGTTNEEKVYIPGGAYSWTGTSVTLSGVTRGADGTPASSHASSDSVTPVMTATDLNEANYAVSQTVGKITAQGDLLYGDGANKLAVLAAGTSGKFLKSNGAGSAPSWANASASNVWSTSGASPLTYTIPSGYTNYLILADVTVTQPASSPGAGSLTLAVSGKTVAAYCGATNNANATANLVTTTSTPGAITVTATKGTGITSATLSNINLIVVGLN
jgi:hypothetical protein